VKKGVAEKEGRQQLSSELLKLLLAIGAFLSL
jgi:hypothetical protein